MKKAARQARKESEITEQKDGPETRSTKKRRRGKRHGQASSPERSAASNDDRDHSPPGSKQNPLQLPAEPELAEAEIQPEPKQETTFSVSDAPLQTNSDTNGSVTEGADSTATIEEKKPKLDVERDVSAGQSQPLKANGVTHPEHQRQVHTPIKKELPLVTLNAPSQDAEKTKKKQNLIVRTLWTLIMISGFLGAVS